MSFKVILELLYGIVSLVRSWMQSIHDAAERDAGRNEAVVEGRKNEDAALEGTRQAAEDARARHRADPTDGAFKHTEFRD